MLLLPRLVRLARFDARDGPQGGRALDVGFAAGFCMAVLRELGFEVHGVEVSETIGSHARDHFGFDSVHFGTLDSAAVPGRPLRPDHDVGCDRARARPAALLAARASC